MDIEKETKPKSNLNNAKPDEDFNALVTQLNNMSNKNGYLSSVLVFIPVGFGKIF